MFSWQSSFFFQYLIDSYEKVDDTSRGNIISALVSYRFPELFIKFILNKGNPQMIPPNTLQCYFSLVVDYCISADFKINDTTLLQIISFLENSQIQTRVTMAGNILRHPIYKKYFANESNLSFPNSDAIMEQGFLIGCHHGMTEDDVDRVCSVLIEFAKNHL